MAENAKMILTWTPSPDATSQQVLRLEGSINPAVNTGTYSVIATLNATASTYTDTTVDPTPMKFYHYKINTICANGSSETTIVTELCNNCDEGNGNPSLFIAKTKITNSNTNEVTFTYEDSARAWYNTQFGTSLPTAQIRTVGRTPVTGVSKAVLCHTCGDEVTYQLSSFANMAGETQLNAEYTHAGNQNSQSYLPSSPIGLNTTQVNRSWTFDPGNNTSTSHLNQDGYFWLGSQTNSTKATSFKAKVIPTSYNIGELAVNQLRISRKNDPHTGNTAVNYGSSFNSFGTGSSTEHFMLLTYEGFSVGCMYWLFKVVRAPGLDITNASNVVQMYGYTIDYISAFDHNGYQFICATDTTVFGNLPMYNGNGQGLNSGWLINFYSTNDINY